MFVSTFSISHQRRTNFTKILHNTLQTSNMWFFSNFMTSFLTVLSFLSLNRHVMSMPQVVRRFDETPSGEVLHKCHYLLENPVSCNVCLYTNQGPVETWHWHASLVIQSQLGSRETRQLFTPVFIMCVELTIYVKIMLLPTSFPQEGQTAPLTVITSVR